MEWEEFKNYKLNTIEDLFSSVKRIFKDLPSVKDLTFTCCVDTYNEIAQALIHAERNRDEFNIRKTWEKLEQEGKMKVNGSGSPCDCRR